MSQLLIIGTVVDIYILSNHTMKRIKTNHIDALALARKHPRFKEYSKEARARIALAAEIYQARTKKGLSQGALAKNIATTQKVISKVENAEVNVGIDLIFRILRALDLKLQLGKTALL